MNRWSYLRINLIAAKELTATKNEKFFRHSQNHVCDKIKVEVRFHSKQMTSEPYVV